jgi:hypothetical protein
MVWLCLRTKRNTAEADGPNDDAQAISRARPQTRTRLISGLELGKVWE